MKAEGRKSNGFLPASLALGTALLLFVSFPGAVGFWPAAWVALVPLLLAIRNAGGAGAARLGFLAGMVHYVSLLYWIVIVLGRYGYLPIWISLPGLLLLACYMSCYTALFCALMSRVYRRGPILAVWAGPVLWAGLDFLRSFLFSGFPWQDLAYSQYKALLLIQTADLAGHYGVTFHIVLVNSVTALLAGMWLDNRQDEETSPNDSAPVKMRRIWLYAVIPAICFMVAVMGYNFLRYRQVADKVSRSETMKIGVVQGNIDQDQKWSPAMRMKTIEVYSRLSREAVEDGDGRVSLLVWPETSLPFLINDNPYFEKLQERLFTGGQNGWLLAGAPHYEKLKGTDGQVKELFSYNSAYLFKDTGQIAGRYDKQHLVPFGEYIPLGRYLPLPGPLVENIGSFSEGKPGTPLSCQSAEIGVLICFESIFPKLARDWTKSGANLLVNITNDAWFGRSSAPWQHLSMAVLRAVENRRSLVRSANTGVSAFIDPLGRMKGVSPLFEPYKHVEDVPLLTDDTLFVSFGYCFGLLCLLASITLLLVAGRK